MKKKEEVILDWIQNVSIIRKELGNFAICPFAARSKFKILECDTKDVRPIEGYDVLIFILNDFLSLSEAQDLVSLCNNKYPDWKFFEDCKSYPTYINGVQTNNGEFNLILAQPKEKLRKFREHLVKTGYYDQWKEDYLKEILGDDLDLLLNNKNERI